MARDADLGPDHYAVSKQKGMEGTIRRWYRRCLGVGSCRALTSESSDMEKSGPNAIHNPDPQNDERRCPAANVSRENLKLEILRNTVRP